MWDKETFNYLGQLLKTEKAVPVCGEHFCDNCGDCLVCYGDDECFHGPYHRWVEYVD